MRNISLHSAVLVAFLLAATPAAASERLVAGPDGVRTVEDPYLPATDLPDPGPARHSRAPRADASAKGPSVRRALLDLHRGDEIAREDLSRYKGLYQEARSVRKRLKGGRRAELHAVIRVVERVAAQKQLTAGRVPVLFLTLERNTSWWRARPFPAGGARITFGDDPVIFQYYPGQGLQIQPLANFGKANGLYNACVGENVRPGTPCRKRTLETMLDRLVSLAARRGTFTTWEYYFSFGGGSPPWTSGLSQGTAVQALARGAQLLGRPDYLTVAADALGAFEKAPPTGVRIPKAGGNHYLIYSFNRRLLVLNGFLQSVIGLHDYAQISGDPRGQALFEAGERAAAKSVPAYDTGAWSLYARRGRESDLGYHRLVRDFLRGLCTRTQSPVYCETADRFTRYLFEDPDIDFLGPRRARPRKRALIRFRLSKISRVSIHVSRAGKLAFVRKTQMGRGEKTFAWVPRKPGRYRIRIEAADLRNHHRVVVRSLRVR